jgi:hypothetical protein
MWCFQIRAGRRGLSIIVYKESKSMTKKQKERRKAKKEGTHIPVPARNQITAPLSRKEKAPPKTVPLRSLMSFSKERKPEFGLVNLNSCNKRKEVAVTNERYIDTDGVIHTHNFKRVDE